MEIIMIICIGIGLLLILALVLELVTGSKRGGCLSSFRLFTVILAGGIAAGLSVFFGRFFVNETYIPLPTELMPLVHDLAYAFAIPVVALILFLVLKLIFLIVYGIGASGFKKGKHAEACNEKTTGRKASGLICALLICVVIGGFTAIPAYRGVSLYRDYRALEPELMRVYYYSQGQSVSNTEMIAAVDKLSAYILDVDYISDDAKVKAINYGVNMVNGMLASSGNAALGNVSLGTYDTVEEHKQQVENIVDLAKTLDETGLLATETESGSAEVIDSGKVIEAISDEKNARALVTAVGNIENGNEMLANVINDTVSEMSGGVIDNLVDAEAMADPNNTEAVVKTLTHASTFTNLNTETFAKMSNEEKQGLINELNEIRGYGVIDADTIDKLVFAIKLSMN